ncbi:MAG: hypothetical protein PHT54_03810 [Candidatus Nanoarchaeia archaeon]|nr:hypothetical protein [Candidatus Nanoarchaeia archaeon]
MFGMTYEDIAKRIMDEKALTREELDIRVNDKLKKLSDLVSKEGAAHIVANELGIKLIDSTRKDFKIKNLFPGVRGVTLNARVIAKYDVREFSRNGNIGRVQNLLIGDDSESCRLVIWDINQIGIMEKVNPGDILKVNEFYVKENNFGKEIHLTNSSKIEINPEGVSINSTNKEFSRGKPSKIKELSENQNATLQGTIVQVFDPKFYDACPECNKKVTFENGAFNCNEHGKVKEVPVPILNLYFDDGSDVIRVVLFRDNAKKVLGVSEEDITEIRKEPAKFESIKEKILGEQFRFSGRIVKNEVFDRLEMNANFVERPDIREITQEMIGSI